MKYLDEFRDPAAAAALVDAIRRRATQPWTIMEVCGGQTHSIIRNGIDQLLAGAVEFIHGPGCPVCVTPLEMIDRALAIAAREDVIFCSFGDMLRVPGSRQDLFGVRARGGDVRVVYSPLDATRIAADNPDKQVVFFGVGFETTAPLVAGAVQLAERLGLRNFSVLAAHVRVPPAMDLLLSAPGRRVQAFLAAGHVCTIAGTAEYPPIAERFGVPVVVTGFEPLDILRGLLAAVRQLESGQARVEIEYARSVRPEGNPLARAAVDAIFEVADVPWRGLGVVREGGLRVRDEHARFDAIRRFHLPIVEDEPAGPCRAAEVLQGFLRPPQCPEFGRGCTPERPLGAPMVSSEGACAAHYRYRRLEVEART